MAKYIDLSATVNLSMTEILGEKKPPKKEDETNVERKKK